MISVVTSCSRRGWEEYGERFVDTFLEFWPAEVGLFVVSEDRLVVPHRVQYLNLIEQSASARDFLARHEDDAWAKGQRPAAYSFRHDAYKFSRKVFAVALVAERLKGRLLWLDADAVTFAPVPAALATSLLPDNVALSCLDRPGLYSECGFVGYNLDHPECRPFIRDFVGLYETDKIFKLNHWTDCDAFDHVRRLRATPTHRIPHRSQSHPFINSELGKYMDHCKGPRKAKGRSGANEQIVHRELDYWRG